IADANPGVAGYMQMSQNNRGGWQLTVNTFARGGRTQEVADDGTATSTLTNDGTKAALEWLQAMRWEDSSLGSNFLLDWGTMNQAFAAGQVAMYTSGSDVFTSLVQTNALDPSTYGLAALPLEGDDAGVLTGGTLAAMPATVDEAKKEAAIKWIDFFYLGKLVDEKRAVADAEVLVANDQPVGTPVLPMFSQEQYEQNQEWIADYINVPLDQMTSYTDTMFDLPLVGEPSQKTQEIYALLDPVVQAVLTDENADVDALLEQATPEAQARPAQAWPRRVRSPGRPAAPPAGRPDPTGARRRDAPRAVERLPPHRRTFSVTATTAPPRRGPASHARADRTGRRRSPVTWFRGGGLSNLVFMLPLILIFGVFSWFPIVRAVIMSVQETNLVSDPTFVGLDNFRQVLADPLLGKAVRNTLYFAFLALLFGYPIPLVAAVLMREVRRARGLYSALAYLPVVVPPVVAV